jgi:hypothetical protein
VKVGRKHVDIKFTQQERRPRWSVAMPKREEGNVIGALCAVSELANWQPTHSRAAKTAAAATTIVTPAFTERRLRAGTGTHLPLCTDSMLQARCT